MKPSVIFICSGKRKSGKDFIANLLVERLGNSKACIIRLSAPLKLQYAKEHNLNYSKLLDSSEYKELHRADMIEWGEKKRNEDSSFFCKHAIEMAKCDDKDVWIVSDARRKTDLVYFSQNYPKASKFVRITASIATRQKRKWDFVNGVDDAESECDLDDFENWDFFVENDDNDSAFQASLQNLIDYANNIL